MGTYIIVIILWDQCIFCIFCISVNYNSKKCMVSEDETRAISDGILPPWPTPEAHNVVCLAPSADNAKHCGQTHK